MAKRTTASAAWDSYIQAGSKEFRRVKITNMKESDFNKGLSKVMEADFARMVKAANQKINRLNKADVWSPAVQELVGGKFSGRDKSFENYKAIREFLNSPTNTVKGARLFTKKTAEQYGISEGEVREKFQRASERVKESDANYSDFMRFIEESTEAEDLADQIEDGASSIDLLTALGDPFED